MAREETAGAEGPTAPQATVAAARGVYGLERDEWLGWCEAMGEPAYRADQVLGWLFRQRVEGFAAMSNLSRRLREALEGRFRFSVLEPVRVEGSADTTRKFLFRLHDRRFVETVLIPASPALYGEPSDRRTACVSSQVGCAYGCRFCASGLAGFTRNLEVAEIVEQVILVERLSGERVNNLVFMGMGEPLANLDRLLPAIAILNADWGANIGARHMTISTSGVVPGILRLAECPLQVRLAVSLHGASDAVRERIMPINRRYPIARLVEALGVWREKRRQRLTFEYILIKGINDAPKDADDLARLARELDARVNLIPYNTVEGLEWERPATGVQERFLGTLRRAGVAATLRREKGHDIDAACGQLRLKEETAAGIVEAPGRRASAVTDGG